MLRRAALLLFLLLFILSAPCLSGQENLPGGYKNIKLGMTKEEVQEVLKNSNDFENREEVLTIRLEPDQQIITSEGYGYILIGYFHFNEDSLYQIFIKLDHTKIGYYNLLKKFTEKYGNPSTFEPKRAIWENDNIRLIIEKPGTLRYVFLPVWNSLLKSDLSDRKYIEKNRSNFLDNL